MKIKRQYRCSAIVKPGEYTITRWEGEQCTETNPRFLVQCDRCGESFCIMKHWREHQTCTPLPEKVT